MDAVGFRASVLARQRVVWCRTRRAGDLRVPGAYRPAEELMPGLSAPCVESCAGAGSWLFMGRGVEWRGGSGVGSGGWRALRALRC